MTRRTLSTVFQAVTAVAMLAIATPSASPETKAEASTTTDAPAPTTVQHAEPRR